MNVKLKAKTYLLVLLEKIPEKWGFGVYHFLQKRIQTKTLPEKIKSSYASFLQFERLLRANEIHVEEKVVLEIGSGWLPIMPYFFKYHAGAREINTYDLNKHYNKEAIRELNEVFSEKFQIKIKGDKANFNLPPGINYFPNTDLTRSTDRGADIIFSRFVLEHVSPAEIISMHEKFIEILKPGAYIFHFISPSDHRAYVDRSLSLQDFLRYSEREWNKKQTRFDYHNRLRLPDYIQLFKGLDLEIVHSEFDVPPKDSVAYKKFKAVPLHEDYLEYAEEELLAGSINLVLKVK